MATKAKTKAVKSTRWSEGDVQLLRNEVEKGPSAKAAFERVAKKLGKTTGTVSQKYYNLKKSSGAPTARQARGAKVPAGGYSRGQLSRLDPADLVKLIATARAVLDAKKGNLKKAEEQALAEVKAKFEAERKAIADALT